MRAHLIATLTLIALTLTLVGCGEDNSCGNCPYHAQAAAVEEDSVPPRLYKVKESGADCPNGMKGYETHLDAVSCDIYDSTGQFVQTLTAHKFCDGPANCEPMKICHTQVAYIQCHSTAGRIVKPTFTDIGVCSFEDDVASCPTVRVSPAASSDEDKSDGESDGDCSSLVL